MFKYSIILFSFISIINPAYSLEKATFAGGCFWCMESPFEKLDGVNTVISGYIDGHIKNPTYEQVSGGQSGHVEAVQITYDEKVVSYNKLLEVFWMNINPTDDGGQFVDRGHQYTTGIFYHNEKQKELASKSKVKLSNTKIFKKKIVTPIKKAAIFYDAEEYHQDYYKKNIYTKTRYKYYRNASGRDKFLDKYWIKNKLVLTKSMKKMKLSETQLKNKLTPLQYKVTQEDGTERPFKNEYWNNKKQGIYVDIVSGEALFSSLDKFKSGTGWPSFTKPISNSNIIEKTDKSLFGVRVEVRSKGGNSHLGHVFTDGPKPLGLRYCINSASLKFIPKEQLEGSQYETFLKTFTSR